MTKKPSNPESYRDGRSYYLFSTETHAIGIPTGEHRTLKFCRRHCYAKTPNSKLRTSNSELQTSN